MNAWARFRADFAYRQGKMYRFWGHRSVQRMFYEAAVAAFTRALAFDPDWIDVLLDRGLIYWRELGQAARAIEDFSAILRLDPSRGDVLFYRGMAHQAQGDYLSAAEDLRAALTLSPQAVWRRNAYHQLTTIESILADLPPRLADQDDRLLSADTSTPP